jgi:anti-sigma regulatory factor (Ser/Thr protein kinase)
MGIEALRKTLDNREDLETAADRLLVELRPPGEYDDDVALLLVRVPRELSANPAKRSSLLLPGVNQSARHVRHHVRRVLRRWGAPADVVDVAVMVADEIVVNALIHGEPPIRLNLRQVPHQLVVEVADGNPQLPRHQNADTDAERGRGLRIVAEMTSRWGSRTTTTGKVVWAEIPFSENHPDHNESG